MSSNILIVFAGLFLLGCSAGQVESVRDTSHDVSNQKYVWSEVDFEAYGIQENECKDDSKDQQVCELPQPSNSEAKMLFERYIPEYSEHEAIIVYKAGTVTIIANVDKYETFICCDIQSPLRTLISNEGLKISGARFKISVFKKLDINLLNNIKTKTIYEGVLPEQSEVDRFNKWIVNANPNLCKGDDFGIENFERKIIVCQSMRWS